MRTVIINGRESGLWQPDGWRLSVFRLTQPESTADTITRFHQSRQRFRVEPPTHYTTSVRTKVVRWVGWGA